MPLRGFVFRRSDHVQNLRQKRERIDSNLRKYQIPELEMSAIFEGNLSAKAFEKKRSFENVDVESFVGKIENFGKRSEHLNLRDAKDDLSEVKDMMRKVLCEEWNENVQEISRISSFPNRDAFVHFYDEIETIDISKPIENMNMYLTVALSSISITPFVPTKPICKP